MCKINIVDARMGKGKSSWAMQHINSDIDNNYVYITPFLSEVERVKKMCVNRKFVEPEQRGKGKRDSLHLLLAQRRNIASTHALFSTSNESTRELIKNGEYILVLDEVMDVVEQLPIKKNDIEMLLNEELITIGDKGLIQWNESKFDHDSRYNDVKDMARNNSLVYVDDTVLMWNFPINVFEAFKEVYIMTYKFNGQIQRYYYDLFEVDYNYNTIIKENETYKMVNVDSYNELKKYDDVSDIRNLINILDHDKLNRIGEDKFALSSSWYERCIKEEGGLLLLEIIKKNLYNYFRRIVDSKSGDLIWTTFLKGESKLKGKGYSNGFLSCNIRATNEYGDRHNLAYCINVFLSPTITKYFKVRDVSIAEEEYALSEMLQWIWRSAIRNGEPINIYIPSSRMRNLLIEYLEL